MTGPRTSIVSTTGSENDRLTHSTSIPVRHPRRYYAALMWALTLLFLLRVLGQAVQFWAPQPFLPDFGRFQGSNLPYGVLLGCQLVILLLMAGISWRVGAGSLAPARRAGVVLAWLGAVYMAVAVIRLAIGLSVPGAHAWFKAWLPALFHVVLAAFVAALGVYHLSASPSLPSGRAR